MSKDRNKAVPASYLILRDGDKVLLQRRINTGYFDEYYALPAGHVEASELPKDALIREMEEELGIRLRKDSISLVHTMYRIEDDTRGDRADYFFEAKEYNGEISNMEPEKCDDLSWFPIGNFPENTIPYLRLVLEQVEKGINYTELGLHDTLQNPTKSIMNKNREGF